jgi:hypothetical protein
MGTLHKSPIHPSKHSSWPSGVQVKCPALPSFDSHACLATTVDMNKEHFFVADLIIKALVDS